MHSEVDHSNDALNRGKFRDHYTNEVKPMSDSPSSGLI